MQITVNQYSVAYDVGLSQLYDNRLNSSLECSQNTRLQRTKHRTKYAYPRNPPRQNHLSFPTNADLPYNIPTRQHPEPIRYPKTPRYMTGLAVFCSDKIDFRSRQEQSCPTTTDETTPYPTPISENSSANGCSRNFELFSFFSCFH